MERNKTKIAVTEPTDVEIIHQIVHHGQRELLEVLYDRYADKVFHKCLSLTKQPEVAKDLAHDIMIKIFMQLAKFKAKSSFSVWVHSITYNHCMDHFRIRKRLKFVNFEAQQHEDLAVSDLEKEIKVLEELQLNQLEVLFEKLKPENKLMLLMRYQDGLSIKQIAAALEINASAVKMRLKRSRDKLAKLINELSHEPK
ncbi:MAG: RNA polymerase sigma factor [Saprospiraceae bacterium]